jgi:hypothetical protein
MNTALQGVFDLHYDRLGVFANVGDRAELDQAPGPRQEDVSSKTSQNTSHWKRKRLLMPLKRTCNQQQQQQSNQQHDYKDRICTPVIIGIRTGYIQNENKIR